MSPLPFVLTLMAAIQPAIEPQPIAEELFQQLLITGEIAQLEQACVDAAAFGLAERQQQLRDRLISINPRPQTLDEVLTNGRALLVCRSPESARVVLGRYSPAFGEERRRWLQMSWQAADAALDHPRAALALRRLVNGDLPKLESIQLVEAGDGTTNAEVVSVNGLDQLAWHEAAAGDSMAAVSVLLAGRATGAVAARRLGQTADLLAAEDSEQADQLLELALDQAAQDGAWGMAVDLLRLQLRLQLAAGGDGLRPRQRLERLTTRLDDRYSVWQLQGIDEPEASLRSPREPGGHAALKESPAESSP